MEFMAFCGLSMSYKPPTQFGSLWIGLHIHEDLLIAQYVIN